MADYDYKSIGSEVNFIESQAGKRFAFKGNIRMQLTNRKIIERIYKTVKENHKNNYLKYLADDVKWNIIGLSTISGKNNFLKIMDLLEFKNFPFGEIKNIISENDFVVVESIGKNDNNSQKYNDISYCDIYRIKNGKIQELTTYIIDTTLQSEEDCI